MSVSVASLTLKIASQIATLQIGSSAHDYVPSEYNVAKNEIQFKPRLVVAGAAALDITSKSTDAATSWNSSTTFPGQVTMTLGGVARNIAEAAHRALGGSLNPQFGVLLVAPVGQDSQAAVIRHKTVEMSMRADGLLSSEGSTAICSMLLDRSGELLGGVSDMNITESFNSNQVCRIAQHLSRVHIILEASCYRC
jgi:pseudouridine-5'-phosphate glycosidase/pseudouridine kinase